jgi:UDP-galactopyranose mutase
MEERDVIVVGGGVSGLSFAWQAAAAGRRPLVLESSPRLGGCIDTRRLGSGFWFEMGAHTAYNSYGGLIEIIEGCGLKERIEPRGDARKRFALLREGRLSLMGPLSVLLQFDKGEFLRSAPGGLFRAKDGLTTYAYYSGIVGKRNYDRVLGPFLAAVPSQSADAFPASGPGSLFKKRRRRKDVPRSFTLRGGLSTVAEGVAGQPAIETRTGATVREVRRAGAGFEVAVQDRGTLAAKVVALAVPPSMAAALVRGAFPELSGQLARVRMCTVETAGTAVAREKVALPDLAFLVPVDDVFYSVVTRDPVPDARWRGFAFHFRPGRGRDDRARRMAAVLGVMPGDLEETTEKIAMLPSPVLGHGDLVREIDRVIAGRRLAVTGNYFEGLAIEDCVLRSRAEWRRVAALG